MRTMGRRQRLTGSQRRRGDAAPLMKPPLAKWPYPIPNPRAPEHLIKPIRKPRRWLLLAAALAATCSGLLAVSQFIGPVDALVLGVFVCFLIFVFALAAPAMSLDSEEGSAGSD